MSRAGPSVDDAGGGIGLHWFAGPVPLGQDPVGGLRQVARDGPDRLRVALPLLDARIAATDVPVRPDLAMETDGTSPLR